MIMTLLCEGNVNNDGIVESWLDIDQLMDRLPYIASKQSIQCSIRVLIGHGYVERLPRELRKERWKTPLMPTGDGFDRFKTTVDRKESKFDDYKKIEFDDVVEFDFLDD